MCILQSKIVHDYDINVHQWYYSSDWEEGHCFSKGLDNSIWWHYIKIIYPDIL